MRRRERGLHACLASVHHLMQQHPQDTFLMEQEHTLKAELAAIEDHRSALTYHASVSSWIMKANRSNKFFFSAFKQRHASLSIRGLLADASGILHTNPDSMLSMAT